MTRYQKRILGLLMDRSDIHMQVLRVDCRKLCDMRPGETSAEVWVRVEVGRDRQRERFTGSALACNADMHPDHGAPGYTPSAVK